MLRGGRSAPQIGDLRRCFWVLITVEATLKYRGGRGGGFFFAKPGLECECFLVWSRTGFGLINQAEPSEVVEVVELTGEVRQQEGRACQANAGLVAEGGRH